MMDLLAHSADWARGTLAAHTRCRSMNLHAKKTVVIHTAGTGPLGLSIHQTAVGI